MPTVRSDLRASGIPSLGAVPWGTHFAVFYASRQELLEVVVPFLEAGLRSNELCSWEIDAPLTVDEVTRALATACPDLRGQLDAGQLELVPAAAHAARSDPDERFEALLDRATLGGYDGLRLARRASHEGAGGRFELAETIGTLNVLAAVTYPRADRGVLDVMRRVQDHRCALVCNSGAWEVLQGSEARSARETPSRTEERLQVLFRNMTEGFAYHRIVRDDAGRPCDYVFLEVNPAFERITGLSAPDVLGKRVTQVLPGIVDDPTGWIDRYGRVALTGEPMQFESHSSVLGRWYAVSAFSSRRGYFAVTFADITERKRTEEALRARDAQLQSLIERLRDEGRRKDEFLGMLSHELRNPLAPIRNSTYILQHTAPGTEQARRAQAVIARQTDHLTRLVDDLLDVTRIARGKIELRHVRLDVVDLIRRAVEDFRTLIEEKGVALRATLPRAAIRIDADPTRITQMVGNLLHNAAKFTTRGDEVSVTLETDGAVATIRVRDTGDGIDPELLPSVFDAFVQGQRSLARTEGGLGLGLALVKGIAELHGGSVAAISGGKGRGAEFVIRLPTVAAVDESPRDARDVARHRHVRRRVLVVDDSRDAAESLAEVVRMLGHVVDVAYDGPAALARARANAPDVVLCDIGLPGMSGYDVARALRATGRGPLLIAVTGYAQPEDVKRAIEAGFEHHVAKPCDPEEIEHLLG